MPATKVTKRVKKHKTMKAAKQPVKIVNEVDEEDVELENLVFGGDRPNAIKAALDRSEPILKAPESSEGNDEPMEGGFGFSIDTCGDQEEEEEIELNGLKPAWMDDDDAGSANVFVVNIQETKRLRKLRTAFAEHEIDSSEYERRLRSHFEKLQPVPRWAQIDTESETVRIRNENELSQLELTKLLKSTTPLLTKEAMCVDKLRMVRLGDANQDAYSQCVVQSVKFHPQAPVVLTCGFDRTLRLFHVDGSDNPKVQSLYFKDMPLHSASFSPNGSQVVLTGRRPYFYIHDLMGGETIKIWGVKGRPDKSFERAAMSPYDPLLAFLCTDGYIALVSLITKQCIGQLKMNGLVSAVSFGPDMTLYSFGSDCEVYRWDLRSLKCTGRFMDEGCVGATQVAVSPDGHWLATGCSSGIVNLYRTSSIPSNQTSSHLKPVKTFMNLTTAITSLEFHPQSHVLLIASHCVKDALRLVHMAEMRVVKNWPTSNTPLGHVTCAAFKGAFVAIGNSQGKCLLYKMADMV